ncbi:MAG: hypothetical protein LUF78_13815 [Clostridiales bacterium]|nr:hypothetical protein [Clostridiales bacterium]
MNKNQRIISDKIHKISFFLIRKFKIRSLGAYFDEIIFRFHKNQRKTEQSETCEEAHAFFKIQIYKATVQNIRILNEQKAEEKTNYKMRMVL